MKFKIEEITAKDRPFMGKEADNAVECHHCHQKTKPPYYWLTIGGTSFGICRQCKDENIRITKD